MLKNLAIIAILIHAQLINTGPKRKVFVTPTCTPSTAGVVQTASGQGGVSLSVPFTSPNTAGNIIFIYYGVSVAGGNPNVHDSNGNSYTQYALVNANPDFAGFYVATGIAAGSNTVTINTFGAAGVMLIGEVTGFSSVETSNPTNHSTGTTSLSIGPITTTGSNDLVLLGGFLETDSVVPGNSNSWSTVVTAGGVGGANPGTIVFACKANIPSTYSNNLTGPGQPIFANMIALKP